MGTRAVVHVKETWSDKTLVTIYTQYDGYLAGFGKLIKSILNNGTAEIVNGIGSDQKIPTHFNGMGCLAAYLVGKLKGDEIGSIYLYPIDSEQEYVYTLYAKDGKLFMRAEAGDEVLYAGLLSTFDPENLEWQ